MNITTHFISTSLLTVVLGLKGIDIVWAYLFGFLIDIDHFWTPEKFKYFFGQIKEKGLLKFNTMGMTHTFIHEPFFIVPVALFSYLSGSLVPLIFWCLHVFFDQVILLADKKPLLPFSKKIYRYGLVLNGTRAEWIVGFTLIIPTVVILAYYLIVVL